MKVETVSRDLGCSIDEAQEAIDNNQVVFDLRTNRYYLKSNLSEEDYDEMETLSYQQYIEDEEAIKSYASRMIYNPSGLLESDMIMVESVCHSLLRRIERIRKYEETHNINN